MKKAVTRIAPAVLSGRLRTRPGMRWSALIALVLSLSACNIWRAVFGLSEDEVVEVAKAVLNVFKDTFAEGSAYYYGTTGTFSYSVDGSYLFEWYADDTTMQRFSYYGPPGADYELHGVLGSAARAWYGEGGIIGGTTQGFVFLVQGGSVSPNVFIDVNLYAETDADGEVIEGSVELTGTVDDRSLDESWGLTQVALDNFLRLTDLRDAAMQ